MLHVRIILQKNNKTRQSKMKIEGNKKKNV